jgi:hypothetical protein
VLLLELSLLSATIALCTVPMYAAMRWLRWNADSASAASACRPEFQGRRCTTGASTGKWELIRAACAHDTPPARSSLKRTRAMRTCLGDGCISLAGQRDKQVWKLRIICADAWPGLIRECQRVMSAVRPGRKVGTQQKAGCVEVTSCSRRWPCLFAQHGPGTKHMRTIGLQPWQRTIVTGNPGSFARGLFHSDGYRESTGCEHISRTATTGTSIRDICLPMSPETFCGCAAVPWINLGLPGASRGQTPYPWRAAKQWRGSTNFPGPNTDAVRMRLGCGRGWRRR